MKYFLLITSLLLSISAFAEDTNTNDVIDPSNQETEVELNQKKTLTLPSLDSLDDPSRRKNRLAEDLVQPGGEEEWKDMIITIPSFPDGSTGRSQSISEMDLNNQKKTLTLPSLDSLDNPSGIKNRLAKDLVQPGGEEEWKDMIITIPSFPDGSTGRSQSISEMDLQQETDLNLEDTNLLAKCSSSGKIIRPGYVFFYIIQQDDKLFVIHDLAHKEDNLLVREQTLRTNNPLYELKEADNSRLYWISAPMDEFPPELKSKSDSLAIQHFESFKRHHFDKQEVKSTIPSLAYFKQFVNTTITKICNDAFPQFCLEHKEPGVQVMSLFSESEPIGYTDVVDHTCHFWFDELEKDL